MMTFNHRRACAAILATLSALVSTDGAWAQAQIDRVYRQNGVDSGQVIAVTPLEVTISKNGVESAISVEDIESVYFAGEPDDLNSVRTAVKTGRLADAKRTLDGIDAADARRDEVAADIEFYGMLIDAQLALGGQGDLARATAAAREFAAKRRTSFHIPQVIELVGDLLLAAGDFAGARTEYAKLAKAKSDYFELRSALLVGRALQAEGKHVEALAEFDKVVASTDRGALIDPMKASASLDRAVSQAAQGQGDEAAATIGAMIAKADPEDAATLARAYNALGDCYLQAKDDQGALFAFLHVDLLYNEAADAHAKALHELVGLWRKTGKDSRAQEAAQELAEKYPGSRWAKQ